MRRPRPASSRLAASPLAAARLLLLLAAAALPLAAAAQQPPAPPDPPEPPAAAPPATWSAGFRLGLFDMINSADSYDAIYGDPMPQVGGQIERSRGRLRFALSLDYGTVDGERVLLTGGGVRGTGIDEELVLAPLHLTAAWRFNPRARWEASAGLGPSWLYWSTDGIGGGDSGSDLGGSVVAAVRRQGGTWDLGGELRWSTFPGALDATGGVTAFFDEDDPGGLALTFLALRRF